MFGYLLTALGLLEAKPFFLHGRAFKREHPGVILKVTKRGGDE